MFSIMINGYRPLWKGFLVLSAVMGVIVVPRGAVLCQEIGGQTRILFGGGCSQTSVSERTFCARHDVCSSVPYERPCTDRPILTERIHLSRGEGQISHKSLLAASVLFPHEPMLFHSFVAPSIALQHDGSPVASQLIGSVIIVI